MESTVRFYYGFEEQTITFKENSLYRPTDTLLYYLRHALGATATREGCGVGDCGACTVVLAEMRGSQIVYYPINACLMMLPMLDGKWLITSEHLRQGEQLHPVQESLLKYYGVQCGFCTSGVLMSMLSMYKNTIHPDRATVEERLTGNLCRCTGYRSILDATIEACTGAPDKFTLHEPLVQRWMEQNPVREFGYKNQQITYHRPTRLTQALIHYRNSPQISLACGGSNLMVTHHTLGYPPKQVLDISAVSEMLAISTEAEGLRIGGSVPVQRVCEAVESSHPEISKLLKRFASYQVRQVASVAANFASASSISDSIPTLMAHHAIVRIAGLDGEQVVMRDIAAHDFIKGARRSALEIGEVILSIFIPAIPSEVNIHCFKVSRRRSVDITMVGLGARLEMEHGICRSAELYYGGMAAIVRRATHAEQSLIGKPLNAETIEAAQIAIESDFSPISDVHASAEQRWELTKNLLSMLSPETQEELSVTR